jgi:hypothetical protein
MNDPGSVLLQYGVAGVAMLVEGWVIARLYGDNKQLQKEKDALQEARRVDAQEILFMTNYRLVREQENDVFF